MYAMYQTDVIYSVDLHKNTSTHENRLHSHLSSRVTMSYNNCYDNLTITMQFFPPIHRFNNGQQCAQVFINATVPLLGLRFTTVF